MAGIIADPRIAQKVRSHTRQGVRTFGDQRRSLVK
jgi:hypothetical protein